MHTHSTPIAHPHTHPPTAHGVHRYQKWSLLVTSSGFLGLLEVRNRVVKELIDARQVIGLHARDVVGGVREDLEAHHCVRGWEGRRRRRGGSRGVAGQRRGARARCAGGRAPAAKWNCTSTMRPSNHTVCSTSRGGSSRAGGPWCPPACAWPAAPRAPCRAPRGRPAPGMHLACETERQRGHSVVCAVKLPFIKKAGEQMQCQELALCDIYFTITVLQMYNRTSHTNSTVHSPILKETLRSPHTH